MTERDDVADEWRRPGPTVPQRRRDVYLGLLLVIGALVSVALSNSMGSFPLGRPPAWPEQLAWSVAVVLPLAWRRVWPEATTVVVAVLFIAAQVRANPDTLASSAALFIAIYTLGAWGRDRRRAAWLRVAVIIAMFGWLAIGATLQLETLLADPFPDAAGPLPPVLAALLSTVLFNLLFFLFAYFFGNTAWTSARRHHELQVQAEELRRSQVERAERAVLRERVRIARELHDVVAHHVSVMGVQAGACRRVLEKDPAKARTALSAVEESARTAVDELRRMLGVLRQAGGTDPAGGTPGTGPETTTAAASREAAVYGLDRVESLVRSARETGLAVRYEVFGVPASVPESVSLAAYRVIQEALTNTIKHARAGEVDVRVRHLRRVVEVEVTDDGRGAVPGGAAAGATVAPSATVRAPVAPAGGAGLGLIGMRERVAAHDGVLEVGPRPGGGFRVRARLPLATDGRRGEAAA